MTKQKGQQDTQAPGHYGNKGAETNSDVSKGSDREEQYQRNRDQAPSDQGGQLSKSSPDPDNNLGRGAPADREERIGQLAQEKARTPSK